jgi:hypothetical protein
MMTSSMVVALQPWLRPTNDTTSDLMTPELRMPELVDLTFLAACGVQYSLSTASGLEPRNQFTKKGRGNPKAIARCSLMAISTDWAWVTIESVPRPADACGVHYVSQNLFDVAGLKLNSCSIEEEKCCSLDRGRDLCFVFSNRKGRSSANQIHRHVMTYQRADFVMSQ